MHRVRCDPSLPSELPNLAGIIGKIGLHDLGRENPATKARVPFQSPLGVSRVCRAFPGMVATWFDSVSIPSRGFTGLQGSSSVITGLTVNIVSIPSRGFTGLKGNSLTRDSDYVIRFNPLSGFHGSAVALRTGKEVIR